RWWDTEAARRWQCGEGTADGTRVNVRFWLERFREDPEQLEEHRVVSGWTEAVYERWKKRLAMSEEEFERHIEELYPGGKLREPAFWRDERLNNPSQPVVGVSWFEGWAYGNWLSAQAGEHFRLPTEAEWEAAARGPEGRRYAHGNEFDPLRGSTAETRIKRTTPAGVFVDGDAQRRVGLRRRWVAD
ncbi:MAG: SUMF1/EgtB/PvdO family nonheme iron enzyme, partial [Longimicrobiales bacterium]|nr:SUMF1/EgtB/PvdO family nonheme iron enzyme [Longimicrobiales bacterium]